MISIAGLTDFFNQSYSGASEPYDTYGPGYQSGNLDILLQKAKRSKTISDSKIWDFIQVENDPHFSRSNIEDKFERMISKLSISTSIVTVIASQVFMADLQEFIPANIRDLLFNFNAISDTNINLANSLEKGLPFDQIENALFSDLSIQFLGKTISLNTLANFANNIFDNIPFADSVSNDSLRPILSLGLQNLLPDSMLGIFDDLEYIDTLTEVFGDEDENQVLFNDDVEKGLTDYGNEPVSQHVNAASYQDVNIDFHDPLGLVTQQQFIDELKDSYETTVTTIVDNAGTTVGLSDDDKSTIAQQIIDAGNTNIDKAFQGSTVGLPSMAQIVKGLSAESHNQTLNAVDRAITKLTNNIISDAGIVVQDQIPPLDYLINVKTNIEKRIEMKRRGGTSQQFVEIETYLRTVIVGGKVTDQIITDLNVKIDELLKESR